MYIQNNDIICGIIANNGHIKRGENIEKENTNRDR